ncbi:MAG: thioredoxin family protein [Acidobacteriota bacterium]
MPRRALIPLLFLLTPFVSASLATDVATDRVDGTEDLVEWSDTARDVWVDGTLRSDVRVLSSRDPARLAFAVPGAPIVVVDTETASVSTLDADRLVDADDRLHATSPEPSAATGPRAVELPEGWWIDTGEQHLLIGAHRGPSGPLDRDALWSLAPQWHAATDAYRPTADAVEALRTIDRPVELVVAFGTWCGDSRRSVPRLLAALDAADNPNLSVELIGIRRGFDEPLATVRDLQVTNVPTVIARSAGEEIGRFVERPVGDNVEADLAAILTGRELVPDERFAATDRWLAGGAYALHTPDGERVGSERFALFATEDGGHRLHAVLDDPNGGIEIWQRLDEAHQTRFVEITRRIEGRELSRTRLWIDDGEVRATTRGDATGIVRQTAALPAGGVLGLPVASAVGLQWTELGRPSDAHAFDAFFWQGSGRPSAGRLESARFVAHDAEPLDLGDAGSVDSIPVELALGDNTSRWWLHPELGLPLRGELDSGARVVLERFEQAAD